MASGTEPGGPRRPNEVTGRGAARAHPSPGQKRTMADSVVGEAPTNSTRRPSDDAVDAREGHVVPEQLVAALAATGGDVPISVVEEGVARDITSGVRSRLDGDHRIVGPASETFHQPSGSGRILRRRGDQTGCTPTRRATPPATNWRARPGPRGRRRDQQAGLVPRHVGVVPWIHARRRAVGGQPGAATKSGPGQQHLGRARPVGGDADDRWTASAPSAGMVLTDAHQPGTVGASRRRRRSGRPWGPAARA